jgi:D-alanyl-D-alanine carboxypeptidase
MKRSTSPCLLITFLVICTLPLGAAKPALHDTLAQRIDQIMAEAYPADQPGASVLVKRGDEVVLRKGYGLASLEWGVPDDPVTVFPIGSISKQITAVAILRLVQEGRLSLDDPITKFFPDFPDYFHTITIDHLMTHTSGIKSYSAFPDYKLWKGLDLPRDRIVRRLRDEPLEFNAGEHWAYTDSGFYLLGAILEKVYGKSYAEVIQEQIFDRLGMKNSSCDRPGRIVSRRAEGYLKHGQGFVRASSISPNVSYAAGALLSTVDDLALWSAALNGDSLVRRDLLQRAFTPYRLADGRSTYYGYGWAINEYEGHQFVAHGGRISGYAAHILRVPDADVLVVVLSNSMDREPNPDFLATKIASHLIGKPFDPVAVAMPEGLARQYVGVYKSARGVTRSIVFDGGRLFVRYGKSRPQEIFFRGHDELFYEYSLARLRFERDATGKVVRLGLKPDYGAEVTAEKVFEGVRPGVSPEAALQAQPSGELSARDQNCALAVSGEEEIGIEERLPGLARGQGGAQGGGASGAEALRKPARSVRELVCNRMRCFQSAFRARAFGPGLPGGRRAHGVGGGLCEERR